MHLIRFRTSAINLSYKSKKNNLLGKKGFCFKGIQPIASSAYQNVHSTSFAQNFKVNDLYSDGATLKMVKLAR